jgi:hypothetical protein
MWRLLGYVAMAIGKGLERITANGEAPEKVFKDVADQLNTEKQPVLRTLKELGEA